MVRWSTELPRLMPLAVQALQEHQKEINGQVDSSKQILVVEDRPGLTFGPSGTTYPVLLVIKNSPFTTSELNLVKEKISDSRAKVIAMPGYDEGPYNNLLLGDSSQQLTTQGLKPPRDDSPFYSLEHWFLIDNFTYRNSAGCIFISRCPVDILFEGE